MIVDISNHNGLIDFTKLKNHVEAVIIRIGYRGYIDGSLVLDSRFEYNVKGCIANNIPYGLYFFSQAKTREEGKAEADFVIKTIKRMALKPLYPIYIDSEMSGGYKDGKAIGRADYLTKQERTSALIGFLEQMQSNNFFTGVYASTSWFASKLVDLDLLKYAHWVADYRTSNGVHYCGYNGDKGIWQYSSTEYVDGITTRVDKNVRYVDYPSIIKRNGMNGFEEDVSIKDEPTGNISAIVDDEIEPISRDAIRLIIGFASSGDIRAIIHTIDAIGGITYEVNNGYIITSKVSKGDQSKLVQYCESLVVPIGEYSEEVETEIKDNNPSEDEKPVEGEISADTDTINWLVKAVKLILKFLGLEVEI